MHRIPKEVRKLFADLSKEFSASVWERFLQLIIAAIVLLSAGTQNRPVRGA